MKKNVRRASPRMKLRSLLSKMRGLQDGASPEILQRLRAEYDDRIAQLQRCAAESGNRGGGVATPQYQQLQQQALSTERDTIIQLRNKHVINDEALRRIQRDLDLAEVRLFGG